MHSLRIWRLIALLLTALSLTMESAHVLELLPKLNYEPQLYATVNGTLYRFFAIIGGFYQTGSLLAVASLAYRARHRRPSFQWTSAALLCLGAAFVVWLLVVAPVNGRVAAAIRSQPETVAALWQELLLRWELGHLAGFILQMIGFAVLSWSILLETPAASDLQLAEARNSNPEKLEDAAPAADSLSEAGGELRPSVRPTT